MITCHTMLSINTRSTVLRSFKWGSKDFLEIDTNK